MRTNDFSEFIFPHWILKTLGCSAHSVSWVCRSLRDTHSQCPVRRACCRCVFWPLGRRRLWSSRSRVMSCDLVCPQTDKILLTQYHCVHCFTKSLGKFGFFQTFCTGAPVDVFYLPLSILNLNLSWVFILNCH